MNFSIKLGDSRALCARCNHGTVLERERGGVLSFCNVSCDNVLVPNDVVRCTGFEARSEVSKYDMEKIAWRINTDGAGKMLGFKPPPKPKEDD